MRRLMLLLLWPVFVHADVRTPCYGTCPRDLVQLTNGTSHYTGLNHVDAVGDFDGHISAAQLATLEKRIHDAGFDELPSTIGLPNIDAPTIIVTVGRKSVVDAMGSSPDVARIVEIIEEAMRRVRWEPVSSGLRGAISFPTRVRADNGDTYALRGDANGSYILPLRPGTYTILKQTVVVHEREWVTVNGPTAR